MELRSVRPAVLFVALALAGQVFGQDASPPREAGSVSLPEARPVEQVVKLWKAGLSEDFLRRKIEREKVVYRLSTDEIIASKAAGLPESVIEAMLKTDAPEASANAAAATPAAVLPVAPAAPAIPVTEPALHAAPVAVAPPVVIAPVPSAPATPSPASRAERSWDGIVKRTPGVVLFKSPWQQGSLSFRAGTLSWRDASDESKSFSLAVTAIREHFLVCPKDASSDEACFEWGVKTADEEFRFRDVAWQRGNGAAPRELFTFLEALYPDLAKERYRVEKRK